MKSFRFIFVTIGAVLLSAGVFSPILSVAALGTPTFYQNNQPLGILILLLALASIVAGYFGLYGWLLLTGGVPLGVTLYSFVMLRNYMSTIMGELKTELTPEAYAAAEASINASIQFRYGWFLLGIGSVMILAGVWVRKYQKKG